MKETRLCIRHYEPAIGNTRRCAFCTPLRLVYSAPSPPKPPPIKNEPRMLIASDLTWYSAVQSVTYEPEG